MHCCCYFELKNRVPWLTNNGPGFTKQHLMSKRGCCTPQHLTKCAWSLHLMEFCKSDLANHRSQNLIFSRIDGELMEQLKTKKNQVFISDFSTCRTRDVFSIVVPLNSSCIMCLSLTSLCWLLLMCCRNLHYYYHYYYYYYYYYYY